MQSDIHFLTSFFCTPIFKLIKDKPYPLPQNETKQIKNFFQMITDAGFFRLYLKKCFLFVFY